MSEIEPNSWRDVIKVHPAADLFPMMSPDELKALGEDIKANGFAHQIVLWTPDADYWKWSDEECRQKFKRGEFYLLDGRNRVAALVSLEYLDGWPDRIWPPAHDAYAPIVLGPDVDPYRYVLSANMHRRHLTAEQKREIVAKVLKAQPEKSNRTIANQTNVDHKTVGAVRDRLEERGEIPHVSTVEDTKGRQQPTHRARRTADAAPAVELVEPKQSDIERVLPDADRLVHKIMARDANAHGYALAVARGIVAHLGDGYPDMPGFLKRTAEPTSSRTPVNMTEKKGNMMKVDNYFGGCPHCGQNDGCANVGRSHWCFCKAHTTTWCIGANLFSSWREQTEEEQRRIYNEIGLGKFTEVEPLPCTEPNLPQPDDGKPLPF